MRNDTLSLKDAVLEQYMSLEELQEEMQQFKGNDDYVPKYNIRQFFDEYRNRTDEKVYIDLVRKLNIEYIDETWQKADWIAVFIAGSIGILLDILITQTNVLKPIDRKISQIMKSGKTQSFKDALDNFSNSFRDGKSASIDFQDFKMYGPQSIHEQYSFGHDPLRFVEGILQIMSGDYKGIDKFGNIVSAQFGQGIPDIIFAVISYLAHMVSDLCNANSLPYPGTTFLMQFMDEKTRNTIAVAYGKQVYNSRNFIYQNLPSFLMSVIIHAWAIYDNWTVTKKINFFIGNNLKYQPMLLVSNAMVMTSNLTITVVREVMGKKGCALFRINWPVIANTIKHSIKYLANENKRINQNTKKIEALLIETNNNRIIETLSENGYLNKIEQEYRMYLKSMEEE
jgi:hypothetical protein